MTRIELAPDSLVLAHPDHVQVGVVSRVGFAPDSLVLAHPDHVQVAS